MSDRFANVTGHAVCPHCVDGLALVQTRPATASIVRPHGRLERREAQGSYEEYGPCPWCELGFKVEYPEEKHARAWPLGYWQGRPPVVVDPPPANPEPLSVAENALRLKLLERRYEMVAQGVSEGLPDVGIGLELAAADRVVLLREYARVVGVA
jgi:hypothetical protein